MEQENGPQASTPGGETLLVLDDEALVRVFLSKNLRSLGYTVLEGTDCHEGLEICRREPVDLVVMDWSMPGLSGPEMLATLHALNPRLRVVVCSGYTLKPEQLPGCAAVLSKPVFIEELWEVVRRTLDGEG